MKQKSLNRTQLEGISDEDSEELDLTAFTKEYDEAQ